MTWLEKRSGVSAKHVTKVEESETMISEQDVVVIGFFDDMDSEAAREFAEAADQVDEAFFLTASDEKLKAIYFAILGVLVLLGGKTLSLEPPPSQHEQAERLSAGGE